MIAEITTEYIFHFMLIFARLGTAFSRLPVFGSNYIFARGRLVVALLVSLVLFPVIQPYLPKYSENFSLAVGYLFIEILIGLIISYAANIYLQSVHYIGQIISLQSGLGAASFFDPAESNQVALFSNLLMLMVLTALLASDVHYLFINSIVESYQKFPPGKMLDSGNISEFVSIIVNDSFVLAFKLSSPFIVVGLAILTGSGVLARLMPNLQVFFVITPAQIIIIIGILYVVSSFIVNKLLVSISSAFPA